MKISPTSLKWAEKKAVFCLMGLSSKIPILVITGPTSSGKTRLSIDIAKKIDSEIINIDSMQLYKYMDIGTAKITQKEMQDVPHHLFSIVEPTDNFSAMQYTKLAHEKISNIFNRNKLPILVGGTCLYIDLVVNNIKLIEVNQTDSAEYRKYLYQLADNYGLEHLTNLLIQKDKLGSLEIDKSNIRRVVRALELIQFTKLSLSEIKNNSLGPEIYYPIYFAVDFDRNMLYQRINSRVDSMLQGGLLEEVKKLKNMGVNKNNTAYYGIGYKELFEFLDNNNEIDRTLDKSVIDLMKKNTRHYAKRQLTWFKKNKKINWVDFEYLTVKRCKTIDKILNFLRNQKYGAYTSRHMNL